MSDGTENGDDGKETESCAESVGHPSGDLEIHVAESDIRNLKILDRSDLIFAVLYGALFVWGLILTLLAI